MTCQHLNVYGQLCLGCGAEVPQPFPLLTEASRQSASFTSQSGAPSTRGFYEWLAAIDGDPTWINEQMEDIR